MATRCTLTIRDRPGANQSYSVYRHNDGYPDTQHGVLETLKLVLSYAWPLPRFEADDFAAAIIAAWKRPAYRPSPTTPDYIAQGGNIRITAGRDEHNDTEYHYEITPTPKGRIRVMCYERHSSDEWTPRGRIVYLTKAMQPEVV